jgi:hypothetical protein
VGSVCSGIKGSVYSGIRGSVSPEFPFLTDQMIDKQMEKSGVKNFKGSISEAMKYAYEQGDKKMDYGVQGILSGDLKTNTFYLRGNVAYNVGDIGNYLFGYGAAELGLDLTTTRSGAHWNNFWKGRSQKTPLYDFGPGTYGAPGWLDSPGDQRAISAGFRANRKTQVKAEKANRQYDLEWQFNIFN